MSGRPAAIRQRDVKQVIGAAKKEGVTKVEVRIGTVPVIIYLNEEENSVAPEEQIRL
jgi:hypothetical protein